MNQSLLFTILRDGHIVATCVYAEDAAMLVGNGTGNTVECNGRTVWREGQEETEAAESYDTAAEVMNRRANAGIIFGSAERIFTSGNGGN